jgi:hypothetical protein
LLSCQSFLLAGAFRQIKTMKQQNPRLPWQSLQLKIAGFQWTARMDSIA